MKRWLFECVDDNSLCKAEEFVILDADTYAEAKEIAEDNFGKVKFWHELPTEEDE